MNERSPAVSFNESKEHILLSRTIFKKYILYWIFFSVGDLERLRRFWLTGTCNPKKEEKKASEPLAPEQFLSAFFILLCGILVCVGLMGLEHAYVKYIRRSLVKSDKSWCFGFISLVSSNRKLKACWFSYSKNVEAFC